MKYRHKGIQNKILDFNPGKVVCVGRNYVEHIHELNNTIPSSPLLFIKPVSSIIDLQSPIQWPIQHGSCHYELELALLITQQITNIQPQDVQLDQFYYGLGIDLTLRDLQSQLKEKGHPWEKAKAFDGSCILTPFMHNTEIEKINNNNIEFKLFINKQLRQHGHTQHMITPIPELVSYASEFFTLEPGDVLLTGTPAGVGPLQPGDELELHLNDHYFTNKPKVSLNF